MQSIDPPKNSGSEVSRRCQRFSLQTIKVVLASYEHSDWRSQLLLIPSCSSQVSRP